MSQNLCSCGCQIPLKSPDARFARGHYRRPMPTPSSDPVEIAWAAGLSVYRAAEKESIV